MNSTSTNRKTVVTIISAFLIIIALGIATNINSQKHLKRTSVEKEKKEYMTTNKIGKLEEIKKNENIVFLGDSITDWYPIEEIFGNLPIVKSGIAGYETNDILSRMKTMVYEYNPTKVFILIGTNDLKYKNDSEEKTAENIIKIIKNISKNRKNSEIYYESILPVNREMDKSAAEDRYNEEIDEVNKIVKEYCKKNNVTYIDMNKEVSDENGNFDEKLTKDGLHPNDLGYARMTKKILEYIY